MGIAASNPFTTGAGLDRHQQHVTCTLRCFDERMGFRCFVLQQILVIFDRGPRKMNEWLQQMRAEGLRIVYVTMGNVAEEGSIEPLFLD